MARAGPLDVVRAELAATLDASALERLPTKYFRVGDVLVFDAPLPEPEARVAEAYARALHCRSVLHRAGWIGGEFREPRMRHVWGDPATETEHREVGVRFRLDPARVMWSPGNLPERQRMAALRVPGETVVDLFAGVGYLSLPLAVHGAPARVLALEKNATAFDYLRTNIRLNRVEDRVEALHGDCRDVAPTGIAHRVLLGLLPDSVEFLPTALKALKLGGGVLHVHRVVRADAHAEGFDDIQFPLCALGASLRFEGTHVVKSYAPGRDHIVYDVRVVR